MRAIAARVVVRDESAPRGFTLIEILVIVIIIGILASLLLPTLTDVRERSRRPACVNNLRGLGTAMLLYTDSEGAVERFQSVPPYRYLYALHLYNSQYPMDPGIIRAAIEPVEGPDGPTWMYHDQGLYRLYPNYVTSKKLFYCPSNPAWNETTGWPAKQGMPHVYSTYNTREAGTKAGGSAYYGVAPQLPEEGLDGTGQQKGVRLLHRRSFMCDASWNGQIAHRDGWNVWYLDSSVRWIRKDRKEARGITSMRREEWFEDVLLPDGMESELGKRRSPSVWRRFDACAGLAKLSEPRPVRLHRP